MRITEGFLNVVVPDAQVLCGTLPFKGGFVTDSRIAQADEIFVALGGARVDGHFFLKEALQRCAGALVARAKQAYLGLLDQRVLENKLIIVVDDPAQALIALAHAWRMQFAYP